MNASRSDLNPATGGVVAIAPRADATLLDSGVTGPRITFDAPFSLTQLDGTTCRRYIMPKPVEDPLLQSIGHSMAFHRDGSDTYSKSID